ncbi:MAG: NAD(P)/FAD-dependent oxidoreductase [Gemmatimonas sp.]
MTMARNAATDLDVLIVGAGISGIGAGIELLRGGITAFALLEAANELGGTWRDNTYPGIAVDIPSSSYCYAFETDFPWSRKFAPGAEIQRYVNLCAEKYGVAKHIRYGSRVLHAQFDAARNTWATHLDNGTVVTSRYLIAATGLFGEPKWPAIPGLDTFAGKTMHTAQWEQGYDPGPEVCRRHWHRRVGGSGHSGNRPAGPAAARVPAHANLDQSATRPATAAAIPAIHAPLRRDSFAAAPVIRSAPRVPDVLHRELSAMAVVCPRDSAFSSLADAPAGHRPGIGGKAAARLWPRLQAPDDVEHVSPCAQPRQRTPDHSEHRAHLSGRHRD